MFSYVELQGEQSTRVLALAPMAVSPLHQRTGIGSALVKAGLERADTMGLPLVVVVGYASYYPRFGFEPARPLGIEPPWPDLPDDVWMIKPLPSYSGRLGGTVRYPPPFDRS
jgi:putative acetyltransferase